jgi:hypothetical protein
MMSSKLAFPDCVVMYTPFSRIVAGAHAEQ